MTTLKYSGSITAAALQAHPDPAFAVKVARHNVARMLLAKEAGTDPTGPSFADLTEPLDPRITWTEEPQEDGSIWFTGELEVTEDVR